MSVHHVRSALSTRVASRNRRCCYRQHHCLRRGEAVPIPLSKGESRVRIPSEALTVKPARQHPFCPDLPSWLEGRAFAWYANGLSSIPSEGSHDAPVRAPSVKSRRVGFQSTNGEFNSPRGHFSSGSCLSPSYSWLSTLDSQFGNRGSTPRGDTTKGP